MKTGLTDDVLKQNGYSQNHFEITMNKKKVEIKGFTKQFSFSSKITDEYIFVTSDRSIYIVSFEANNIPIHRISNQIDSLEDLNMTIENHIKYYHENRSE